MKVFVCGFLESIVVMCSVMFFWGICVCNEYFFEVCEFGENVIKLFELIL